ncbi:MAG: thermonuclease family protein [Verrucomicrobiales bacterium]
MSTHRLMARSRSRRNTAKTPVVTALVILLAIYLAYRENTEKVGGDGVGRGGEGAAVATSPADAPAGLPAIRDPRFELFTDLEIARSGGNDGDSFKLRFPGGRQETFRLYFVDSPETSNRYPDRIRYQGDYFGGLSPGDTIAVGEEAKAFSLGLLERRPFAVMTRWESVMKSYRYHAFVLVETSPGSWDFLSALLVREGLARIYTMPADLPDGRSKEHFKKHLRTLEDGARKAGQGAWGR